MAERTDEERERKCVWRYLRVTVADRGSAKIRKNETRQIYVEGNKKQDLLPIYLLINE